MNGACRRCRLRRCALQFRRPEPWCASGSPRYLSALSAPEPMHLHYRDLTAPVVAQRQPRTPKPMAGIFDGGSAQPGPQLASGSGRGRRQRQTLIRGMSKPNHRARQQFRHPQPVLEHAQRALLGGRLRTFPWLPRAARPSPTRVDQQPLQRSFCSRSPLLGLVNGNSARSLRALRSLGWTPRASNAARKCRTVS